MAIGMLIHEASILVVIFNAMRNSSMRLKYKMKFKLIILIKNERNLEYEENNTDGRACVPYVRAENRDSFAES